MSITLRLLRAPRTLGRLFVDRYGVRWALRAYGVEVDVGCRFAGFPVVKLAAGSRIVLGDGVLINSRFDSNPATLPHPTMLSTLRPGATIRVEKGVGLSGVSIVAAEHVEIGPRTLIGSGTVLWDTDFHPLDPQMRRSHPTEGAKFAPIRVGADAFIGARAIILKGVTVGDGAVVAAGAVVTSDVPAGATAAGNPAKIVRVTPKGT